MVDFGRVADHPPARRDDSYGTTMSPAVTHDPGPARNVQGLPSVFRVWRAFAQVGLVHLSEIRAGRYRFRRCRR
jgi:hypothetical protein